MSTRLEILKYFHGPLYSEGSWSTDVYKQCLLCKTSNCSGKDKHWAKGLCKSCYRRVSVTHRLYIDKWESRFFLSESKLGKKSYKSANLSAEMDLTKLDQLLPNYEYRCAYCKVRLQNHNHTDVDAFQLEYLYDDVSGLQFIPICRSCNCSKKNLQSDADLRAWAAKRGIQFPFTFRK